MLYIKHVKKSNVLMAYVGLYSISSYQYRNVKVTLYILGKSMSQTSQKSHGIKFEASLLGKQVQVPPAFDSSH